jgi:hypothetical protein
LNGEVNTRLGENNNHFAVKSITTSQIDQWVVSCIFKGKRLYIRLMAGLPNANRRTGETEQNEQRNGESVNRRHRKIPKRIGETATRPIGAKTKRQTQDDKPATSSFFISPFVPFLSIDFPFRLLLLPFGYLIPHRFADSPFLRFAVSSLFFFVVSSFNYGLANG